jgi:hypothetical protein
VYRSTGAYCRECAEVEDFGNFALRNTLIKIIEARKSTDENQMPHQHDHQQQYFARWGLRSKGKREKSWTQSSQTKSQVCAIQLEQFYLPIAKLAQISRRVNTAYPFYSTSRTTTATTQSLVSKYLVTITHKPRSHLISLD